MEKLLPWGNIRNVCLPTKVMPLIPRKIKKIFIFSSFYGDVVVKVVHREDVLLDAGQEGDCRDVVEEKG